jgi:hypothetical protein
VRIPYPERVPINRVVLFAVALFSIQMLEGTALYFSTGCAVFIVIAAFAFNAAGGLTRASGAYVFFYSFLVVIIGICYKAFLGEPAQSNLSDPRTTIEAYVASIAALYGAVIVSRRLSRKTGLLQNLLQESEMQRASVGCFVIGIAGGFAIELLGESGAGLESAFNQLNDLIPLGIIIGVIYEVRRSGGTRSINPAIVIGAAYMFINGGIIYFSKQAMLTPPLCWLLPVCALRYRLSTRQVLCCLLGILVLFRYLVPYSQYGRTQVPENSTLSQRVGTAASLVEHPDETRRLYLEGQATIPLGASGEYYNTPQGFWDRLQFVSIDDTLIDLTDRGNREVGFGPITEAFLNVVPRFIWHNKPPPKYGGNFYAHELGGGISDEDTTTGISFSVTAEAYHMAKWVGVLVIAPLLWLLLFVVFDSLVGDLRATPWGLLAAASIGHVAPEGAITGLIHFLTFGVEILVFCAFFATWVAPIFAIPILGPDRRKVGPRFSFRTTLAPEEATDKHA